MARKYAKTVKALKRGKNAAGKLHRYFLPLLAGFLALIIGSAYLYWKLERGGEGTLGGAVWTIMFTLIGQGEFAENPSTPAGRVIVFLLSIIGISMLGVVLSELLARVMKYNIKSILGLNECRYRGHTIICGWNTHADLIIRELTATGHKVALIAPAKPDGAKEIDAFFVAGDPSDDEKLKQAGIENADTAIILSQPAEGLSADEIDARTILTGLAVETLRRETYTVAELINPSNAQHAEHAGIDDTVFAQKIIADITATAASQQGITSFIADLLTESGSRLCTGEIDEAWNGKTVGELFYAMREEGLLPIGLTNAESGHAVDPRADTVLGPTDCAVYITADDSAKPASQPPLGTAKRSGRGTVVCGRNSHALRLIDELCAADGGITLITPDEIPAAIGKTVKVVKGDPSDSAVLRNAGIGEASTAVVLASGADRLPPGTVDAKTILTLLAIESTAPDVYTVGQILRPENCVHARRAKADSVLPCEAMIARCVALCAAQKGTSGILNEILCRSEGHNLDAVPLTGNDEGKTVGEIFARLRENGALPLALIYATESGNGVKWQHITNPDPRTVIKLPMKAIVIE